MSITVNTEVYSEDTSLSPDKVRYTGPSKTAEIKDNFDLIRVAAKPTGTFRGMVRSEVKHTKTLTLDDGSKADVIVRLLVAWPVGAAQADVEGAVDKVGDFAITAACKTDLVVKHDLHA